MLWFHNGCIHVAVWSGDSAVLWDYKDMLRSVAQRNHYKIDVVLTKSKEALLQSIRFFSKKPYLIIIADSLNSYQYRMFLEQLERRRSRAKVFLMGTWKVPEGYEKMVMAVEHKVKLERYLEREMDWIKRKRLWELFRKGYVTK